MIQLQNKIDVVKVLDNKVGALHNKESAKIIFEIVGLIRLHCKAEANTIIRFARHYYASITEEDLTSRDPKQLYHTLISHWRFIKKRRLDEVKIRVYNPSFGKSVDRSAMYTVVELSQVDKPFLVDSLLMVLNQMSLAVCFIVHIGNMLVKRDTHGNIVEVLSSYSHEPDIVSEAHIYAEIGQQPDDPKTLKRIEVAIHNVMAEVIMVVNDFHYMKEAIDTAVANLIQYSPGQVESDDVRECVDFLKWLSDEQFVFLGYAEYGLKHSSDKKNITLEKIRKSRLGIFKNEHFLREHTEQLIGLSVETQSNRPLLITKSNAKSTVHRSAYMDVILVKKFDVAGEVVGESHFIGLYTSSAYHSSPRYIPFLRHKVNSVLKRSGFDLKGHDGKILVNILESFPRDELFQMTEAQLYQTAMSVLHIQERHCIRLFIRSDVFQRFFSCMIYVPRDLLNTELRVKFEEILMRELQGIETLWTITPLESILSRIDFIIRVDSRHIIKAYDAKKIEAQLIVAGRDWRDDLKDALGDQWGETQGMVLYRKYVKALPVSYRERFSSRSAAVDIEHIEQVLQDNKIGMCFYRMLQEPDNYVRFKLFRKGEGIALTDVLPILENMGLRVIEEHPYEVRVSQEECVWISDFGTQIDNTDIDIDQVSGQFRQAFSQVWYGHIENDRFNRLVLEAGMTWQEILIFRAYAKYFKQITFPCSLTLIEDTLSEYAEIIQLIIKLFHLRCDPKLQNKQTVNKVRQVRRQINQLLDSQVDDLYSDRILRQYVTVIMATLRTNYYQLDSEPKEYVAFKLSSADISGMPLPRPKFEIFIYSPRVEGVHLRGAKVSRGGIRWSDRHEDFRTEILGLMKAQQVKNAVIIPSGAKGGFVAKCLSSSMKRDAVLAEVTACYKTFIRGLLDLTDNLKNNRVIPPKNVVRHDDNDTYLVVAADKGTAEFSDIANAVAKEYDFWLDDAFASGGSYGYDHKKMGITARGAWESVKRHFWELGHDTQSQSFTVVGIGDMSGDVFGNGMLLSRHIRLVAAFNHMHVFIDPKPNAAKTYLERQRLFNLPRSTWADFSRRMISKGGGVFERSAKSIHLTPQIKELLGLVIDELEPNRVIQAILCAQVDLLWSGGIGTYIKASTENNHDVADHNNDSVRIDATALNCRVVAEGGNLGLTQLARIEYALQGGLIYTDAIDNSAGVDCSDHEVNIKILLNEAMRQGELTMEQRNALLVQMQDEVAALVLRNNYKQTESISSGLWYSNSLGMHIRLLQELEREKDINRHLEFLPSDKVLATRRTQDQGLVAPEFAVLMSYVKTLIKNEILGSKIPEESYFQSYLDFEFPKVLQERFGKLMSKHPLRREIIATKLTNQVVRYMGITFVHRMYDETGVAPATAVRAFVVAIAICDARQWWVKIEKLDGKVSAEIQYSMMNSIFRIVRRAARWLLRSHRNSFDVLAAITNFKPQVDEMLQWTGKLLDVDQLTFKRNTLKRYQEAKVPRALANRMADYRYLSPAFDIIEGAYRSKKPLKLMVEIYYKLTSRLSFGWMRAELSQMRDQGYWELLAGSSLRDDLDRLQCDLAISVIKETDKNLSVKSRIDKWIDSYDFLIRRWIYMISNLKTGNQQFTQYHAVMRALGDLVQVCKATDISQF